MIYLTADEDLKGAFAMKQNRVDRIMAALKEMGLHQMLIVDPMSIYYLTGVYVSPFERFYGLYLREDGHHAFFLNRLFTVPQEVGIEKDAPETMYSNTNIKDFLDLDYAQFLAAIHFLYPESEFSTEHGVKGEEYDNVVFVVSRGWNQYQFEKYAPMIKNGYPADKEAAFIRNRNLFYVCCSRPKKRLFLFITIPIDDTFYNFLKELAGESNIVSYSQFLAKEI